MNIVIDFDKTIVYSEYPEIIGLKPNAKKIINKLYDGGHKIIINTCRAGRFEAAAYDFLDYNEIKYHYINCNLPELIEFYKQDCRKISGDVYIDDKNLGGIPEDWDDIYKLLNLDDK